MKLSELIYKIEDGSGHKCRITEYDDFPLCGEMLNEKGEPYRQFTAWNIQAILNHFKIKKYSL